MNANTHTHKTTKTTHRCRCSFFEFLTFRHSKELRKNSFYVCSSTPLECTLEQKYVTKNFLSEIFSHGILYITLHHFPCMPRHALKNVGCLVVYMILVEFLKASPPDITNSQISTHCHRFVLQFEHYINMNIHTGIMAHLNWILNPEVLDDVLYISQRILGTDWYIYQHLS